MTDSAGKSKTVRSTAIAIALIAAVSILLLLVALRNGERGSIPTAIAAEKLTVRKTSAEEIQSWIASEMKKTGAKIGVVNIWATWCEPCRDEMPVFAKFQKSGLAPVFLISADNEIDEPIVRSFLIEKGVSFDSSLIAGDQQKFVETWQRLSSDDPAKQWAMNLPATFLVDATGKVKSFIVGGVTERELTEVVKKVLNSSLDTAHD